MSAFQTSKRVLGFGGGGVRTTARLARGMTLAAASLAAAAGVGVVGVGTASAQPVSITTNTTIGPADTMINGVPLATADISIIGAQLTINRPGQLTIRSLIVTTNAAGTTFGTVTHPQGNTNGVNLNVTGDVFIDTGCSINVDSKGFAGSQGLGRGESAFGRFGGGAGYGGAGGDASGSSQASSLVTGLGGGCYGFDQANIFAPALLGSGGGNYWSGGSPAPGTGGAGGGAVRLSVGGTLTLNGVISARGGDGASVCCTSAAGGGGSGGSVMVSCSTLAGAGSVNVNGGAGGANAGGGGGAGRAAIVSSASASIGAVTVSAVGGTGSVRGGPGTLYTRLAGQARGTLVIDGGNASFGEVCELFSFDPNDPAAASGPLTLDANVVIRNNGVLGPAHQSTNFNLTILGDLNMQSAGFISANGRGSLGSTGPGAGGTGNGAFGGGGGYGGIGGRGSGSPTSFRGLSFGALTSPSALPPLLGSGGGNYWSGGSPAPGTGGAGGGAVRLSVGGTLTLNGVISARGGDGASVCCTSAAGGGGSGGSVMVSCSTLAGAGSVNVNGGAGGANAGGGGGGGRVVFLSCSGSAPTINLAGGTGSEAGLAGTSLVGTILQPVDATVCSSSAASFSIAAVADPASTYRWQRETAPGSGFYTDLANGATASWDGGNPGVGALVSGASSPTLTIAANTAAQRRLNSVHAARYRCVVTGSCGTVNSSPVQLTVCRADFNCDGARTIDDIFLFVNAWFASDPQANVDGGASRDIDDIFFFLNRWFGGC